MLSLCRRPKLAKWFWVIQLNYALQVKTHKKTTLIWKYKVEITFDNILGKKKTTASVWNECFVSSYPLSYIYFFKVSPGVARGPSVQGQFIVSLVTAPRCIPWLWCICLHYLTMFIASSPHVLVSSVYPPVESGVTQSPSLFPRKPILALEEPLALPIALNPSLLQLRCKEAGEPISVFHVLWPSEVARYFPSARSEYSELACLLMTMNLSWRPIFIPRQTWEKGVFQ